METSTIDPFRPMWISEQMVSSHELRHLPERLPKTLFVSASLYRLLMDDQIANDIIEILQKRILHRWRSEGYLFRAQRIWFWQGDSQNQLSQLAKDALGSVAHPL